MRGEIDKAVIGQMKFGLDEFLAGTKYYYRIVCEDGQHFIGTCDFDMDRINLTIVKGMVVSATLG